MDQAAVKKRVVGVDISLEETTYAVVDAKGDIFAKKSFPTNDYPDVHGFVSALSGHILDLVEQNGGYETIRAVGISAPSASYMTGCIINSANLPWKGVIPLAAMLRGRLGLAVAVANDAHAIALGEHAFGCAHGMQNFVLITLGSGMGSCFFSNGVAHQGNDGMGGEIGHTCVALDGRQCGCGNHGCLETYTGARGIVQTARELMSETTEPSLMRGVEELTPKMITAFCEQGDKLAQEVYRRTGEVLGMGLANYASLVDPEAFIFAGGVSKAGDWLLEPAKKAFESYVFPNISGHVQFLLSELDDEAHDVLGASVLAWEAKEYSLFK